VARTGFTTVDEYLAAQPAAARAILASVRRTIRAALPQAQEVISYQIPTYKLHGRVVIYFAGWKAHYAIYPATPSVLARIKTGLASYEVRKGTIRFPLAPPVPVKLIARIAKLRAREVATRAKRKAAK
jgi:uncharacterized protein YdhG (YjbR/CyaY superfamily)